MDATWPAASITLCGPWMIREGQGGGKRVSAATAEAEWSVEDLAVAEAAMIALGQGLLFLVRAGDTALDAVLADRGYTIVDPVLVYSAPVSDLGPEPDPMTAFPHWPPLAVAEAVWAEAGIGPARLAVMARAAAPKCAILGRSRDRVSGAAFVALHGRHAMLHALEVVPSQRRQGAARNIVRRAAGWARENGATELALAVTEANIPARSLYASLGMQVVEHYHYRQR